QRFIHNETARRRVPIVVATKSGTHLSTFTSAEGWTSACAGDAISLVILAVSLPHGERTSFPDRLAAAGEAVFGPLAGNVGDDLVAHADRPAPLAPGFGRQLVGGFEADLPAEP